MVQGIPKTLTLEEFLKLPETKPASEFINSQIIQKPMPQGKHSAVQGDFVPNVNQVLRTQQIARAFPELRCTFGGRSIVPDVAVFTWARIPRDSNGKVADRILVAPDWVIEILSPDQNQTKVIRNILHCLDYGTQMGWLIDPNEALIFVYRSDHTITIFEQSQDRLPVPDFASPLELTVGQIDRWLED